MSLMEPESQAHGLGKHPNTEDIQERSLSSHDGDVESGSEPDVAEIERIYRFVPFLLASKFLLTWVENWTTESFPRSGSSTSSAPLCAPMSVSRKP